jgi:hypothetical protein
VRGQRPRAQPRHHRPVRDGALRRIGARLGGHGLGMGAPGAELLEQPRLADPGFARHQDEPRAPVLRGPPEIHQARPLLCPADDRGAAERFHPPSLAARGSRSVLRRQQRLVGAPCRRRRLHPELPLQDRRARVVDPYRPSPVPLCIMQPHEHPVGLLPQWVGPQQPLRVPGRLGMVAAALQQRNQALQRLEVGLAESLALAEQPLVVGPFEQVAPVEIDRVPQRRHRLVALPGARERQGLLEGRHVHPVGGVPPPPQRPRRHLDEPVEVGEGTAQGVQEVAEVGPRLRLGRVGPQQEGKPLSRLRRIPAKEQVGQQRLPRADSSGRAASG